MNLIGEIEIKDPKAIAEFSREGKILFEDLDYNKTGKICFDVTVEIDVENEITIHTSMDDENIADEFFYFKTRTKDGQGIGLGMSISQLRVLAEIFQSYITAYDLLQRCKGRGVKAESA